MLRWARESLSKRALLSEQFDADVDEEFGKRRFSKERRSVVTDFRPNSISTYTHHDFKEIKPLLSRNPVVSGTCEERRSLFEKIHTVLRSQSPRSARDIYNARKRQLELANEQLSNLYSALDMETAITKDSISACPELSNIAGNFSTNGSSLKRLKALKSYGKPAKTTSRLQRRAAYFRKQKIVGCDECGEKAVPCTKYCAKHLASSRPQQLIFKQCNRCPPEDCNQTVCPDLPFFDLCRNTLTEIGSESTQLDKLPVENN